MFSFFTKLNALHLFVIRLEVFNFSSCGFKFVFRFAFLIYENVETARVNKQIKGKKIRYFYSYATMRTTEWLEKNKTKRIG